MNKLVNKRKNNFQKTLEAFCSCTYVACTSCYNATSSLNNYRNQTDTYYKKRRG